MTCKNCGSPLPENAKFCPECGHPVETVVLLPPDHKPGPPRATPWHSKGILSPDLSPLTKGGVNVLIVLLLFILQAGLNLLFNALWFESDAGEPTWMVSQLVGMVPVLVLIVYIFLLDAKEHEPKRLLLKLFITEALVCLFVVGDVEEVLSDFFYTLCDYEETTFYLLADNFFATALVEELAKFIVLYWLTWRSPHFNWRFDGVVYAAVVALGFAACENVFYIDAYGLSTALGRALSAIPGHCADGILMGVFYGQAKVWFGRENGGRCRLCLLLAVLAPVLEHGFYDFMAGLETGWIDVFFELYILTLNAVIFTAVWRQAQRDEAVLIPQSELPPVVPTL